MKEKVWILVGTIKVNDLDLVEHITQLQKIADETKGYDKLSLSFSQGYYDESVSMDVYGVRDETDEERASRTDGWAGVENYIEQLEGV